MVRNICGSRTPSDGRCAAGFRGRLHRHFVQGVVRNVHHVDVRSLYPSLMLTESWRRAATVGAFSSCSICSARSGWTPASDAAQHDASRARALRGAAGDVQGAHQLVLRYLGFSQARFNDFDAAEQVTAQGRDLLRSMIAWLREQGATPIEIDTDGIYFVPPREGRAGPIQDGIRAGLPEGIEVEFDGEYAAMYSHRMKNYALLSADGQMTVKGAALKSRGLEWFQRQFMQELIRLKLEGKDDAIPALKLEYDGDPRAEVADRKAGQTERSRIPRRTTP